MVVADLGGEFSNEFKEDGGKNLKDLIEDGVGFQVECFRFCFGILEKHIYKIFYIEYYHLVVKIDANMKTINQAVRLNYTRMSESIQAELTLLSELSELTDDERFKQSIAEVIYSINELSDTLNLQRRYLKSRDDAE